MSPPAVSPAAAETRVYVWQWPVRLIHWTLVITIIALAITGFYIADPFVAAPGEARERFVMGWMRHIHFWSAIGFVAAIFARMIWFFIGNAYARWDQMLPVRRERQRGLLKMGKFYANPVGQPPEYVGHNPLAGLSYVAFYGLSLAMMATGFALYSVSAGVDSPMRFFRFLLPILGGAQTARWLHHAVMWLMFAFAMFHIYAVIFVSRKEQNGTLESIFSGFKIVKKAHHG
jgi:Ni/Fe-hydrogenase 1 B-type cytochrome subunit